MTIRLPEHRQIELYTKKKSLAIAGDEADDLVQAQRMAARMLDVFVTLDRALGAPVDPGAVMAAWAKYRWLPRRDGGGKLTAEVYRTLRIFHAAMTHETGRIESRNGLVKASATVDNTALSIRLTMAGADLLESFVIYRLQSDAGPYPAAYVEAMLTRYWADISEEIRWYHDEDRVLFQYRDPYRLNRHFRFDCDNPRFTVADGTVRFDIGAAYRDAARFPIDFFVVIDDALHIVPVEALTGQALPLADLPQWRARTGDGLTLPAAFRARFTREVMAQGLPMT